jgi:hypothetical protein
MALKKRRTDFTAPLSVSGCGCGRWNVAASLSIINQTREPRPSLILPPQALNRLSISLQAIVAPAGSAKIVERVLRWLLFIGIWYYFLIVGQAVQKAESLAVFLLDSRQGREYLADTDSSQEDGQILPENGQRIKPPTRRGRCGFCAR